MLHKNKIVILLSASLLTACGGSSSPSTTPPSKTQQAQAIYDKMTLQEKIGQLIQPNYALLMQGNGASASACDADLQSETTPDEQTIKDCGLNQIAQYHLGSVLQGGGPLFSDFAPTIANWARYNALAVKVHASAHSSDPLLLIGNDAVHMNMHIQGAVTSPHNMGAGASNDPVLLQKIAHLTALDSLTSGFNWVFAPTVADVQDTRWGRSYEGFSADHSIVQSSATASILGLENRQNGIITGVLATAKHFIGDGATQYGLDEGNDNYAGDENSFWLANGAGYESALNANVGSIMASFSAIDGDGSASSDSTRMHFGGKWNIVNQFKHDGIVGSDGKKYQFPGIMISDWQAPTRAAYFYHQAGGPQLTLPQIYAKSINGGIDVQMIATGDTINPQSPVSPSNPLWYESVATVVQAFNDAYNGGLITESTLHDAVMRVLEVKLSMKSESVSLSNYAILQAQERPLALQAARQSLVLLKNESATLPINPSGIQNVVFVGDVNDIGIQNGGWSVNWQGQEGNQYYTGADKISSGANTIESAVIAKLGNGVNYYYVNGSQNTLPQGFTGGSNTLVIGVVNEPPYAEYMGDIANPYEVDAWYNFGIATNANLYMPSIQNQVLSVTYSPTEFNAVNSLYNTGTRVVTVIYSGRPVILQGYTGSPSPVSSAEIAAFLPGTTGGQAVTDSIFGDYHFGFVNSSNNVSNKLPFPWPADMTDIEMHFPTGGLYPLGYGLTD